MERVTIKTEITGGYKSMYKNIIKDSVHACNNCTQYNNMLYCKQQLKQGIIS